MATTLFWVLLYWLPLLLARGRGVPAWGYIGLINLILGWTLIGWLYALYRALSDDSEAQLNRRYGLSED